MFKQRSCTPAFESKSTAGFAACLFAYTACGPLDPPGAAYTVVKLFLFALAGLQQLAAARLIRPSPACTAGQPRSLLPAVSRIIHHYMYCSMQAPAMAMAGQPLPHPNAALTVERYACSTCCTFTGTQQPPRLVAVAEGRPTMASVHCGYSCDGGGGEVGPCPGCVLPSCP